ncbi:MAG: NnrS family protein [Parachlamydiales bacterium]
MTLSEFICKDPFRLFFPFGSCLAIAGVFPWALLVLGFPSYPVEFHRSVMMNGFMLSFVAGFLMTAVPRFTSAEIAKVHEILFVFSAILIAAVLEFSGFQSYHHLGATCALAGLIFFAIRRFRSRKANPPYSFVFLGLGLMLWFLANLFLFLEWTPIRDGSRSIWSEILSNGAMMSIVLGVGGRLIPGILGWTEIVSVQRERYEKAPTFALAVPAVIWILVVLYLLSFLLLGVLPFQACLILRLLVIAYFAVSFWKLYRPPFEKTRLSWGIWISCWCFLVGAFLTAFFTDSYVHVLHSSLIGGFSLLTILVATRVTLAHGPEGKALEKSSKIIPIFALFLLFALFTRVTAPMIPSSYLSHLSYAAILWMAGFLFWMFLAIPRMWKKP